MEPDKGRERAEKIGYAFAWLVIAAAVGFGLWVFGLLSFGALLFGYQGAE